MTLDLESIEALQEAAALRRISLSQYVSAVSVTQAKREVKAARNGILRLSPAEQLTLAKALMRPARLTAAQKRLGRIMRGID